MLLPSLSDHRKGLLLTAIGGLALSMDIPLVRLAHGDMWSILGARSITTVAVTVVLICLIRYVKGTWPVLVPGKHGLATGLLYGCSTLTFLLAVFNTATANVVFIVAFNPMFGALLSWIFLKERPSLSTLVTMAVMVFGVGLIVRDGLAGGHVFGDAMALLSAFILASAITVGRASRRDMGFVPLLAAAMPAILGFANALPAGLVIEHPAWIVLNGALLMPVAFWCLATGPRYLSAPEVGMFYLLETILAPIWIWLIFAEAPPTMTLIGGTILVCAIMAHSLWMVRRKPSRQSLAH
ncbi:MULTISPECIES: DMT family transporter [unclassified Rhizobium]|uniref:DMT family transporter n=1 Tax=unclassified Rhizobium TaxID=2613769 RepID=UPI00161FD62F|nr:MULTISPECIES: DMT family transporter [unclassified Rhizobium]MBB3314209.1 drug/metabolite transporter (DMT)-like permease [Rhizobium sp. BK181]MBB3539547.1 drug/metabolite transporter (DMT)-like permease [Rhizobium sp. BK399]MCS3741063.1 drug/metabolite transporter (DMT)-like permease [Rhizobium sp. BK661]MCS4093228.1 drug/metabolite transporter (DMT)-like permease [Rhizobium sp. BK176]